MFSAWINLVPSSLKLNSFLLFKNIIKVLNSFVAQRSSVLFDCKTKDKSRKGLVDAPRKQKISIVAAESKAMILLFGFVLVSFWESVATAVGW